MIVVKYPDPGALRPGSPALEPFVEHVRSRQAPSGHRTRGAHRQRSWGWPRNLARCRWWLDAGLGEALALGQASERARLVVGAYTVEVEMRAGIPTPRLFRERLRATGPSVDAEPKPMLSLAS